MQPSIKNDLVYLLRILESVGKISIYSRGYKTELEFFEANDQQPFNACLALLMNIGEQANKLSNELRETYPYIAWKEVKAYRNRVAHDYTGIDKFITFQIITEHLPALQASIQKIIEEQIAKGNFDVNEALAAKGSSYYRHVDFTGLGL
jgi:uncharacterized protein with HEPN domain